MNTIIDIKPTSVDEASDYKDGGINLGRLYFDETIGKMKRNIARIVTPIDISESSIIEKAGLKIGESNEKTDMDIQRRTWLRIYPDPISAQTIYEYEKGVMDGTIEPKYEFEYLEHWIELQQIRDLMKQNNPFGKIIGYLKMGKSKSLNYPTTGVAGVSGMILELYSKSGLA